MILYTIAYTKRAKLWYYAYPNTAAIYRSNNGASIVQGVTATSAQGQAALSNLGRDIDPLFAVETNLFVNFQPTLFGAKQFKTWKNPVRP